MELCIVVAPLRQPHEGGAPQIGGLVGTRGVPPPPTDTDLNRVPVAGVYYYYRSRSYSMLRLPTCNMALDTLRAGLYLHAKI